MRTCMLSALLALAHTSSGFRNFKRPTVLPPGIFDPSQVNQLLDCCGNQRSSPLCTTLMIPMSTPTLLLQSRCQQILGSTPQAALCAQVIQPIGKLKSFCSKSPSVGICTQCKGNSTISDCLCQCSTSLRDITNNSSAVVQSCTSTTGPTCKAGFIPEDNTTCWCSALLQPDATKLQCNCSQYDICDVKPSVCFDTTEQYSPEHRLEACIEDPETDYDLNMLKSDSVTVAILAFIFPIATMLLSTALATRVTLSKRKLSKRVEDVVNIGNRTNIPDMAIQGRLRRKSQVLTKDQTADVDTFSIDIHDLNFFVPAQSGDKKPIMSCLKSIFSKQSDQPYKQLIHNVSCQFKPGTLTAIMGPSGAGKTTLLNLLSGRASSGEFSGSCMLNGQPLPRRTYNSIMSSQGYVLQQDCFLEWLTVKQWVMYEAMLRLPDEMPYEHKVQLALVCLDEVDLMNASQTKIGGTKFKGISGGQRRRLSIAVELLRMPAVLLCDEPTSGLDSTSSLKVVQLLKNLASQGNGRTVVTTIHQPRSEIIALFDNVLLLGTGGHVIFLGPVQDAVQHLQDIVRKTTAENGSNGDALDFSKYNNPADFLIDVVGLDPEAKSQIGIAQDDLISAWAQSNAKRKLLQSINTKYEDGLVADEIKDSQRSQAGVWNQVRVLLARRISCMYGSPGMYMPNFLTLILVSLVVGIAFSYDDYDPKTKAYELTMFLFCISSYAMIVQYLILPPIYYEERAVLRSARASRACSFVAYVVGCALEESTTATIQCSILMLAGQFEADLNPDAAFVMFRFVLLLNGVLAFQGLICWVTTLTDSLATAYNIIFLILAIGSLFGGLFVQYSNVPSYFLWAYYTSIPMMTFRGLVVNDLKCCHLSVDCKEFRDYITEVEIRTSSGVSSRNPIGFDDINETAYEMNPYYCFDDAERSQTYSGDGNLGRYYLANLDFEQISKDDTMLILVLVAFLLRVFSVCTFLFWEWRSQRLVERSTSNQYTYRGKLGRSDSAGRMTVPPARAPQGHVVVATSIFGVATPADGDETEYETDMDKSIELKSLLPR